MAIVAVRLEHILLDPSNRTDLAALPEEEAAALLKESYGFLSSAVDVSIEDGIAIIRFDEPRGDKVADALKAFEKGNREANRGAYQKAIQYYSRVVDVIPHHIDARRNLAMAHLELGDPKRAKELLRECLKVDPSNVWTYVLLGNIATKHDRSFDVAEFYYEAGLAVTPEDNLLLNNFGALRMEQGRFGEAKALFERALAADPSYPNTYYGLAFANRLAGEPAEALAILENLFHQPKSSDIRSEPVYRKARELYAELCAEISAREATSLLAAIVERKSELEAATGHTISIEEDNSLEYVSATAQMAWKHGRDEHRVRYRMRSPAVTPHLVAHELEHIVLEHEARSAGRNRMFVSTAKTRERAVRSIADHIVKLQRKGHPEDRIGEVMLQLINGLNSQILNCPSDMVVEHNLFRKYPELRHSQFVSLRQQHEEALKGFTSEEIKRLTPSSIFRASVTLNCAYALFIDHLLGGLTDYASAYRSFKHFQTAQNLFSLWKKRTESFRPGDEYELVDEFARQLKLRDWYEWHPDTAHQDSSGPSAREEAPKLITEDPKAYEYCLDALRRFDGLSREHMFAIVSEISLLGMTGIDHTTPGVTYKLNAYPREKFTGLHLLCLMYVGFQLYDPAVNSGLDFSDAYQRAQEARRQGLH